MRTNVRGGVVAGNARRNPASECPRRLADRRRSRPPQPVRKPLEKFVNAPVSVRLGRPQLFSDDFSRLRVFIVGHQSRLPRSEGVALRRDALESPPFVWRQRWSASSKRAHRRKKLLCIVSRSLCVVCVFPERAVPLKTFYILSYTFWLGFIIDKCAGLSKSL